MITDARPGRRPEHREHDPVGPSSNRPHAPGALVFAPAVPRRRVGPRPPRGPRLAPGSPWPWWSPRRGAPGQGRVPAFAAPPSAAWAAWRTRSATGRPRPVAGAARPGVRRRRGPGPSPWDSPFRRRGLGVPGAWRATGGSPAPPSPAHPGPSHPRHRAGVRAEAAPVVPPVVPPVAPVGGAPGRPCGRRRARPGTGPRRRRHPVLVGLGVVAVLRCSPTWPSAPPLAATGLRDGRGATPAATSRPAVTTMAAPPIADEPWAPPTTAR